MGPFGETFTCPPSPLGAVPTKYTRWRPIQSASPPSICSKSLPTPPSVAHRGDVLTAARHRQAGRRALARPAHSDGPVVHAIGVRLATDDARDGGGGAPLDRKSVV